MQIGWVLKIGRVALLATAGIGVAAADVKQTLDSVDGVTQRSVREMRFGDPDRDVEQPYDFRVPLAATAGAGLSFEACQRAANGDLYCVYDSFTGTDGKLTQPVRRWTESGSSEDLFSCTDSQLGLDTRRANPCTSMTVDLAGNIWLGGRDGTAHSVIKVVEVPQGGSCEKAPLPPGATASLTDDDGPFKKLAGDSSSASDFCFRRYATGRPIIVDMTPIDARIGSAFQVISGTTNLGGGAGVLLLEDRKTAMFVADPTNEGGLMLNPVAPVEIASGKSGWALVGNESVQSVALMQVDCTSAGNAQCFGANDKKANFVLVTTSTGKIIAKKTDPLSAASVAFAAAPVCDAAATPQFWVRVSPQSGQVYLGDRGCSVIRQLQGGASPPALVKPTPAADLSTQAAPATVNVPADTLNTVSVSPGVGFNLNDCFSKDCVFVPDSNGNQVGAKISAVTIDAQTGQSGLTVFRIEGIPDCRNYAAGASDRPAVCNTLGVVTSVNGVDGFLDVAKLLPLEVKSLFNDSTKPTLANLKLLISPQYRARPPCDAPGSPAGCVTSGGNTFGAFFGRTEDDASGSVVFRDTFALKFDIGQLNGSPVRCGYQNTTTPRTPAEWDVIVTSSERNKTANLKANESNPTLSHSEMLVNTFCENPTSGSGDRWSLYAYGLMLNDMSGVPFRELLDGLYEELELARKLSACTNFAEDGNANQPLSPSVCTSLASGWLNGRDKLTKCIDATRDPKQSAGDQNCQAFSSQLESYRSDLRNANINWYALAPGQVADRANRLGELKARTDVIRYILNCQFLPEAGMTSSGCTPSPAW